MPITRAGDISIEYYIEGEGPPLLLIMGLGGQASSWGEPFLAPLRERFTVIRFSNRGTGLSDKPGAATTVRMMADDAANLLDAIGVRKAHVMGVSMGGMIAQELALNYANRVQGLVLGCTNCGPAHSPQHPAPEVLARFGQLAALPAEERVRQFWLMAVTEEFIERGREFLDGIMELSLAQPTPWETFGKQFAAVQSFDSYDRLPQIKAPTLILHGDRDALVPPVSGELLHQRIAGSRMEVISGVGHCFFWEQPRESARLVSEFLSAVPAAA